MVVTHLSKDQVLALMQVFAKYAPSYKNWYENRFLWDVPLWLQNLYERHVNK